mmetsp:Transcript_29089/g.79855  ORF Transcript_29089/g.79855 Transcript_29089/m.79855 type:complete len:140 (-) Transcript_29089:8-427(-)
MTCASSPLLFWLFKRLRKPTWLDCLKILTSVPFTPSVSPSCPRISSSREEFVESAPKQQKSFETSTQPAFFEATLRQRFYLDLTHFYFLQLWVSKTRKNKPRRERRVVSVWIVVSVGFGVDDWTLMFLHIISLDVFISI